MLVLLIVFSFHNITNTSIANVLFSCFCYLFHVVGIDFKIKTIELGGKRIKLQIW